MRKENILLVLLIAVAVLGIGFYFKTGQPNAGGEQNASGGDQSGGVQLAKASTGSGIDWKSYSEGIVQASEEDKHIFLYFYTDW